MRNDCRVDANKIFEFHPYAREILYRLTGAGHEAVLIGGVVLQEVQVSVV